jgi:uncharacterized protein YdeI (YjbR/CyaY-like superfamily)
MGKKDAGVESVRYPEVLERALCFGWIDGRREALDERYFLQRYTPRRPHSRWSRINRDTAQCLIAEGRMRPAGLAEVRRAKADGRWDAAYDGQKTRKVPEDLQHELDAHPGAKAFFDELSSQNRYAILYQLQDAKRPETRARRLRSSWRSSTPARRSSELAAALRSRAGAAARRPRRSCCLAARKLTIDRGRAASRRFCEPSQARRQSANSAVPASRLPRKAGPGSGGERYASREESESDAARRWCC